jgi:hypothetical protein
MPVEIREMVIKGVVGPEKDGGKPAKPGGEASGPGADRTEQKPVGRLSYALRRQIVQECVHEVMDKLNRRLDR